MFVLGIEEHDSAQSRDSAGNKVKPKFAQQLKKKKKKEHILRSHYENKLASKEENGQKNDLLKV
ncbi:hypothetical protein QG37_08275 [Candidozyma auris]|nr:hypothetical protein QG37_08275 [[Candida] auris]